MKSKNLPKLKFKMLYRESMTSDLPLDLSLDRTSQTTKPTLFKPYAQCNSAYNIKSHQIKSALLSNQMMINELMMKSLVDYPYSSPFMYKLSSSLSASSSLVSERLTQPITFSDNPSSPSLSNDSYHRSSSYSPTSIASSHNFTCSSANSTTSFDFNYKPLVAVKDLIQQPIDLSRHCNEIKEQSIKIKPKKLRKIKENQKLMNQNPNQILIKCPSCWQLFDQENSLRKHIKSKHQISDGSSTFDRIHKCEHCVLAFTRFDMLQRHNRKHTGEKPYECNMCFQNFSRSDHLNTHRINHFGLKMYKCSKCAYASSRRDMVSRHLQTHSNGGSDVYVKTDQHIKQLCKKLVHSTPDQIPDLLDRFQMDV